MTTQILGPRTSRRRRRFLLAPIFLIVLVALFVTAGAQAVHDIGVFQLDKDATTLESPPVSGEDWDLICKANPTTCTFAPGYAQPAGTTTASPHSFVVDPSESSQDDILKGGTKDDNEISSWKWASAKPSPPKNDLTHGFAAEYAAPNGDNILYFGADRFSRNGSANIAFWFLQDRITKASAETDGTCAAGAGCPFDGLHTAGSVPHDPDNPGDILIISAFGPKAAINVYEWVGIGNATNPPGPGGCFTANCSLEPLVVGGQACEDVTDDNVCATVNDVVTPSPWTLNQKEGPANSFQPTNFFEGGLNLTALGVDACFSSFVINTRSSAAGDAELHDLILGQFARCEPALTTQASTNGSVTPGTAVHDTATVTVTGATNPDDATGTVDFFLCADTVAPFMPPDCSTGGIAAGADIALTDTSVPADTEDGISGANSADVNTAASPLAPGAYCFAAVADLTNYDDPARATNTTTECFTVAKIPSQTVTTPVDDSGVETHSITLGGSIKDKAVVTGTAAGGDPTGDVTFFICGPIATGTCDGTTNVGTQVGSAVALVSDGDPATFTSSATSAAATPGEVGRYCFRAEYGGSSIYNPSSDSSENECFTVSTTSAAVSRQRWLPNDSAQITTVGGAPLTGTLSITLRTGSCDGPIIYTEPTNQTLNDVPSGTTFSTTNSSTFVNSVNNATPYYWRIEFNASSEFVADITKCETTSITINDNP